MGATADNRQEGRGRARELEGLRQASSPFSSHPAHVGNSPPQSPGFPPRKVLICAQQALRKSYPTLLHCWAPKGWSFSAPRPTQLSPLARDGVPWSRCEAGTDAGSQ